MTGPYNKFSEFLKQRYAEKVWKISIDAGFTCPHKVNGGCVFCRNDSFSRMQSLQNISITEQIEQGIKAGTAKMGIRRFLVYFQSSTNTFAPISVLREYFFKAISYQNVVGLSIATRPDCLSGPVIKLLEELSHKTDLWIELGLQSVHEKTLRLLNRGHSFSDYVRAVRRLLELNVRICTHIMVGLPGETHHELLKTADEIAHNHTHEVKLHPLLVLRDTAMEKMYTNGHIPVLALDEYIIDVCDFLERLPPFMVIQRLTAEAPRDQLIAPLWAHNKMAVLNGIEGEFRKRKTRQGECYRVSN